MRRWRATKHEHRVGAQAIRTEYKALSSIFIAEDWGLGCWREARGLGRLGTKDSRPYVDETQAFHGCLFSVPLLLFRAGF